MAQRPLYVYPDVYVYVDVDVYVDADANADVVVCLYV